MTLDVMRLGDVQGWLRCAALARHAGLPGSSHAFAELSVQLLALTLTSHRLEYLDFAAPILIEPVQVRSGLAGPSDRPGTGLEWNEPLVRHLAAWEQRRATLTVILRRGEAAY